MGSFEVPCTLLIGKVTLTWLTKSILWRRKWIRTWLTRSVSSDDIFFTDGLLSCVCTGCILHPLVSTQQLPYCGCIPSSVKPLLSRSYTNRPFLLSFFIWSIWTCSMCTLHTLLQTFRKQPLSWQSTIICVSVSHVPLITCNWACLLQWTNLTT